MYEKLISDLREEAKWALTSEWEVPIMLTFHLKQAADAIEELQAQLMYSNDAAKAIAEKVPKWIPVTELLPEEGTKAMTFQPTSPNSDGLIRIGINAGGNRWVEAERHSLMRFPVTHWMPLPEPPKEETDGE